MKVLFLIESDCLPPVRAIRDVPYSKRELLALANQAVYADSDADTRAIASALYASLSARACILADTLCSPHASETVAPADVPAKVVLFHYNPDRKA